MNRKTRAARSVLLGVLLLLVTVRGQAQVTTATIEGLVVDPSGAVIPGATVTVASQGTVLRKMAVTNERGEFTVTFLPPGLYTVSIEVSGFKMHRETALDLVAGQKLRRDFRLELGGVGEQVTVNAEAPLINAVNAQQDINRTETEVKELPLVRRDLRNILNLGTGISAQTDVGVSMNGLPPRGFLFTIDGINAAGDAELRSLGLYQDFNIIKGVSIEAVEQVQVAKSIFSADVANTVGGNVNLITKKGTNQYHGTAFENYQAGGLNARNQFLTTPESLVFHQFGGSLGGPIRKDSMFFFGAFEGYRLTAQRALTGFVPTQAYKNLAIATTPAMKTALDLIPLPTDPADPGSDTAFYRGRGAAKETENHAVMRWDWNVTPVNLFSARYKRGRPFTISPRTVAANAQTQFGLDESIVGSWIHVAPSWSSETRGGYNRDDMDRIDGLYNFGITTISAPNVTFGDGRIFIKSGSTSTIDQNFALTRGRHALKFGGTFQNLYVRRQDQSIPTYTYQTRADFIGGIPLSASYRFGLDPWQLTQWQVGAFIQDDIKVTRRLMVNLGFRYDYYSVPRERDGRIFNHDGPGGPFRPADSAWNAQYRNFSPRFGLALRLDESGKTVLRAGYGIFFSSQNLFSGPVETIRNGPGIPTTVTFSRAELTRYGLNYGDSDAKALAFLSAAPINTDLTVDPNWKNPYSQQWTLGIQHQLTGSMVFDIAYVGSHALRLPYSPSWNRVDRVTGLRPIPGFGAFDYYQPADSSNYNSLQTSLQKRFSQNFSLNVNYTWASNLAYFRGDMHCCGAGEQPQDLNNLRANRGPTTFFVQHSFRTNWIYELPFERWARTGGRFSALALGGWQVSGILIAQTGQSFDVSQTSAVTARPDRLRLDVYTSDWKTTLQYLDLSAFAKVAVDPVSRATVRPGSLGHRALFQPGFSTVDLALSKRMRLSERFNFQVRADLFNAFNQTFFAGVTTGIDSATFGRFTSSRGARVVQLNTRLQF
jgi:hypothetical protein